MRHNDQESGRESRLRAHYPWLQTKNSARNEESESSNCLFASTLPGQETSANPLTLMNQKDLATALLTAYVSLRLIAQPNKTARSPPFSKEAKHCIPHARKTLRRKTLNTLITHWSPPTPSKFQNTASIRRAAHHPERRLLDTCGTSGVKNWR